MNNPLINPGIGTFFWMMVSFGILAFILGKWGWPMLLKALNNREAFIDEQLKKAQQIQDNLDNMMARNEEMMRKANADRDEILSNARQTRDSIIEEGRQKATEEAERIVANAREAINYEKLKAMHDLKNQIATLSIEIAEKLMKQELQDRKKADELIHHELDNVHLN
ncbi:MAG: F0F1 ATP synthase subunit B [Bacteroidales bacterium]|nr:F0F1 ATP synthase subunit B [Bacteroidales bacterium]